MQKAVAVTLEKAVDHLIRECASLSSNERALIVVDASTADLGNLFAERCRAVTTAVELRRIPRARMHGTEPPATVAAQMRQSDIIFGLTHFSMAHTSARRDACEAGARYLSMPEYSFELLVDPSLKVDFKARAPIVRAFADAFTAGSAVKITTPSGTDISLDIRGRIGNYCPGFVKGPGELGSPPDIEANVSPVETASDGIVVIDGSIPCAEIGLLQDSVELEVRAGRIVSFRSRNKQTVDILEQLFLQVGSERAYVLAECGVGLNDAAKLTGVMLTDEGCAGCLHFGFGSNATVGGCNEVPFHLDFVFREADLFVDGRRLIERGTIVL